jgi:hypothetical protein
MSGPSNSPASMRLRRAVDSAGKLPGSRTLVMPDASNSGPVESSP